MAHFGKALVADFHHESRYSETRKAHVEPRVRATFRREFAHSATDQKLNLHCSERSILAHATVRSPSISLPPAFARSSTGPAPPTSMRLLPAGQSVRRSNDFRARNFSPGDKKGGFDLLLYPRSILPVGLLHRAHFTPHLNSPYAQIAITAL